MKKTYINPTMEVVNLNMEGCLMAGSSLGYGDPTPGAGGAEGRDAGNLFADDEDWLPGILGL